MLRNAVRTAAFLAASVMPAFAQDIKPRLIRFGYGLVEDSNQGRAVKLSVASAMITVPIR